MDPARPSPILVAIDGSDRANHVVDAAVALARALGAELVAIRVVGIPRELPRDALDVTPDRVLAELIEEATASVSSLLGGRAVRIRVEPGTVVETISRVADEESAGIIVIGAHGYRFAERVLGTTAARIVDASTRSVLVVR